MVREVDGACLIPLKLTRRSASALEKDRSHVSRRSVYLLLLLPPVLFGVVKILRHREHPRWAPRKTVSAHNDRKEDLGNGDAQLVLTFSGNIVFLT